MSDRVDFTRSAADRIANAVRLVEQGDRDGTPLRFGKVLDAPGKKLFRICTFTGAWSIGSTHTVTFKNQTATPNTLSASNLFWPLPESSEERDCAIAKDGTSWYLLVPRMYLADAATAAIITTAALEFKTLPVVALATAGTSTFSVSISTCATATT